MFPCLTRCNNLHFNLFIIMLNNINYCLFNQFELVKCKNTLHNDFFLPTCQFMSASLCHHLNLQISIVVDKIMQQIYTQKIARSLFINNITN